MAHDDASADAFLEELVENADDIDASLHVVRAKAASIRRLRAQGHTNEEISAFLGIPLALL